MADPTNTIILCTEDELEALLSSGKITEDSFTTTLSVLFDVLLEHYGYQPGFAPNDVY